MTFQELSYHLEDYGCSIDPFMGDGYWAYNPHADQGCLIEDVFPYAVPTLCHYFYELAVPPPDRLREAFEVYKSLRDEVNKEHPIED